MATKLSVAVFAVAALFQAGCAHAQTTAPAAPPAGGVSVPNRARTTTGFRYSGTVGTSPSGGSQWVDYPTVTEVTPGSPADRVGLRVGDVILSVNGRDGHEPKLFPGDAPGISYVIRVRRGDVVHEFTVSRVPRVPDA